MTEMVKLLTIREVAKLLRIHPNTAYRLRKKGDLPSSRVGNQYRVPATALASYLARGGDPE